MDGRTGNDIDPDDKDREARTREDAESNNSKGRENSKDVISKDNFEAIPGAKDLGLAKSRDDWHEYEIKSRIESSRLAAFQALLSHFAPGTKAEFKTESMIVTHAVVFGIDLGPVLSLVNRENFSVTNITLNGHRLEPGVVSRQATVENGQTNISTVGVGNGLLGSFNSMFSGQVWGALDKEIDKAARTAR